MIIKYTAAQAAALKTSLNEWIDSHATQAAQIAEAKAVPSQEPVAWMFTPLIKNPRVASVSFTTNRELALSWGYHGDKTLGNGTVTALGAIE